MHTNQNKIYFFLIANITHAITAAPTMPPSSKSAYTEEEKRVLEHTSTINTNIFVPFMSVDLKERFVYPIPFSDKVIFMSFMNCHNSL